MTGAEIFEALSFVDERYIQEAETARLGRNTPWMKVLSVAACLCILITGVYAYKLLQPKGAMESIAEMAAEPEAAAPAEAPAATEAAAPKQEFAIEESAAEEAPAAAAGELQHVVFARLQVVRVLDGGEFEAIVKADEPMEMDTQVTVVIDPSKVPGADTDHYTGLFDIAEGDHLEISNGAYDAEQNILYVSHVLIIEE